MVFTRNLGRSGIRISALGMGCWAIGGPFWIDDRPCGWGDVDDTESVRAIRTALAMGITFFDTANVYGAGHSERVLARALENHRKDVVIATKFSNIFEEDTRQVTGFSLKPEDIRLACEDSLRRLNTDYIDLYQLHRNDYSADKVGPVIETLELLVNEGKIRSYGWSTDYADRAKTIAQGENCTAIQLQLNVLEDNPSVIEICECYNLAAINRGPLAMGLLTGKYQVGSRRPMDDVRGEKSPDWLVYFTDGKPNPEWLHKLESVRDILTSDGRTLAQGALAWLWARSPQTVPIPGFRTAEQVQENCVALDYGALSDDLMQEIAQVLGQE